MKRRAFIAGLPLFLAACGAEKVWAPDEIVSAKAYRHDGPPRLTLITMKNTGSDNGAHTALMINASQRVLWDPAGTFKSDSIPERNDVLFGITPMVERFYISYHSRVTYYTVIQELDVTPEVAEAALRAVLTYGAVPKANCTRATSQIMKGLPGFSDIRVTLFPNNLADQFGQYPGVRTREYRETDSDDRTEAAQAINAALTGAQ
ncbi:hypothetical protein EU803_14605 [Loktanella sp. IMCC34160]|uniref:hypothetical protein n=1 Tax=Loktanella sp. IMCC34160 TaxID=2510646 RepID=UPI00101C0A05|nr:hypothetical protein [Loktanella sp. IMCC34160]RYG90449.1 hypothetical protein EU803_14605 [Loktanella sp. IMCC34160]